MMASEKFGVLDFVVFGLTIFVSLAIGIVFAINDKRKKRNTLDHYFLGDRKAKIVPVMLSFVVTFQSSILLLGFPVEGYMYGLSVSFFAVGYLISMLIAILFVVPVFYPLKLTSVYEYFYLRYGNRHLLYVIMTFGVIFTLFYMGTVTYGTSVALEVVMGIPKWATILIYLVVTTIYTSVGGMNAVIWADVFQFSIMCLGIVTIITKGTLDTGGIDQVLEISQDRFNAIDLSLDPRERYTVWNVSFGTITIWLICCFMQPAMQRMYSMPSVRAARNMYFLSFPVYSVVLVLCCIEGPVLFAYFNSKGCDVIKSDVVEVNGLVPLAVLDMFQNIPGVRGLFIASLSSAALSTLSSCLSGLAALTFIDIIKVQYPDMLAEKATQISKLTVVFFGIVALGMSFLVSELPGSIMALFQSFGACLDGPVVAIFLMSIFSRRVTSTGLMIAVVLGAAFPLWINLGRMYSSIPRDPPLPSGTTEQCWKYQANATQFDSYINSTVAAMVYTHDVTSSNTSDTMQRDITSGIDSFYKISFMLYSFSGFVVTVIASLLLSLVTKAPKVIDERCLFSFKKCSGLFSNREQEKNRNERHSTDLFKKNEDIPLVDSVQKN